MFTTAAQQSSVHVLAFVLQRHGTTLLSVVVPDGSGAVQISCQPVFGKVHDHSVSLECSPFFFPRNASPDFVLQTSSYFYIESRI